MQPSIQGLFQNLIREQETKYGRRSDRNRRIGREAIRVTNVLNHISSKDRGALAHDGARIFPVQAQNLV